MPPRAEDREEHHRYPDVEERFTGGRCSDQDHADKQQEDPAELVAAVHGTTLAQRTPSRLDLFLAGGAPADSALAAASA